jgi:hypothetical protein
MPEPLGQNVPAAITALASLVACIYYFGVWLFVGRDRPSRIVAISYEPPHNLSPVAMRYLLKKGLDEKGFTAALIDMAARGCIEIQESGDCYVFSPGPTEICSLPEEEKTLAEGLLKGGFAFELRSENHERVYQAVRDMKHRLDILCEGVYFRSHRHYLIPGALLSAALMIYLALVLSSGPVSTLHALFLMPFALIWTFVFILLLMYARHAWRSAAWLKGQPGVASAGSNGSLLICLVDGVAEAIVLVWLAHVTKPWVPILLLFHAALLLVAYHAIKAPTRAGRKLMDEIEGFRRFICAVEADRLNRTNPPDRTPALFERYLPYAFALDSQQQWAAQFADVTSKSAVGKLEVQDTTFAKSWASLDLSSFGLFVERWFPFEIGKLTIEIGPSENI